MSSNSLSLTLHRNRINLGSLVLLSSLFLICSMIFALILLPSAVGSIKNVFPINSSGLIDGRSPSLVTFDFTCSFSLVGSSILFGISESSALRMTERKMIFCSSETILYVSACPTLSATPTNLPSFSVESLGKRASMFL